MATMQPNELRIGNLVLHENKIYKVISISRYQTSLIDLDNQKENENIDLNQISGLEVCEDLLLKNGWIYEKSQGDNYYVYNGKNSGIAYVEGFLDVEFPYNDKQIARVWTHQNKNHPDKLGEASTLRFWHELQNLFHALTQNEL